jgi:hypothetical protein
LWRRSRSNHYMGRPIATFRWDAATDVDFKNLSVREIQVP